MLSLVKTKGGVGELSIQNPPPLLLLIRGLAVVFLSWQNNVCPVKIRSKRSSVLLLCLLRIFTGQTLHHWWPIFVYRGKCNWLLKKYWISMYCKLGFFQFLQIYVRKMHTDNKWYVLYKRHSNLSQWTQSVTTYFDGIYF